MAEPASTTVIAFTASAMGLTIFGIATGLHPPLLIAGLAGGLWALFYGAPQPLIRRCLSVVMAALVSAWVSPVVASSLQEFPFAAKNHHARRAAVPRRPDCRLFSDGNRRAGINGAIAQAPGGCQ